MARVVAVFVEVMLPVHTISLPVFDSEVLSQQVGVQCQVEEELGSVGRDFVENLLLRWLVGQRPQTAPRALLQLASHVKGEEVPVLVHLDGERNFIVIEAGQELLWGEKENTGGMTFSKESQSKTPSDCGAEPAVPQHSGAAASAGRRTRS